MPPSSVTNGGTSRITRDIPPTIANRPTRQNWCTADGARDIGLGRDFDVAAEHRAVGHDHAVAHGAVVGDVRADHEQAAAADLCDVAGIECAVDGAVFAKHVAVADFGGSRMLGHVDVLRHSAEHGAFEHEIIAAQLRSRFHRHAGGQITVVAQHDSGLDHAEGADSHIGSKLGVRTNNSKRVDRHGWVLSEKAGVARQVRVSCRPAGGLRFSASSQ